MQIVKSLKKLKGQDLNFFILYQSLLLPIIFEYGLKVSAVDVHDQIQILIILNIHSNYWISFVLDKVVVLQLDDVLMLKRFEYIELPVLVLSVLVGFLDGHLLLGLEVESLG